MRLNSPARPPASGMVCCAQSAALQFPVSSSEGSEEVLCAWTDATHACNPYRNYADPTHLGEQRRIFYFPESVLIAVYSFVRIPFGRRNSRTAAKLLTRASFVHMLKSDLVFWNTPSHCPEQRVRECERSKRCSPPQVTDGLHS